MENRIYTALLVALLAGAYASWTYEDTPTETAVALIDAPPAALEKLELKGRTSTVTAVLEDVEGTLRARFTVEKKPQRRTFWSNETFEEDLGKYARLEAARSLGALEADELEQTGLDAPSRTVSIITQGQTLELEVGGETNGARDFYVREKGKAEVYLLSRRLFMDLESPGNRFMQRKLRRAPAKEVVSATLTAGDRSLELLHKNRLSPKDAYWSTADAPETPAEAAGNFMDKIERLSALEYLDASRAERFEGAPVVLRVAWTGTAKALDTLELRRAQDGRYWARTAATHAPVEVSKSTGEQIESDLALVFP